jgi:hypothetical protein
MRFKDAGESKEPEEARKAQKGPERAKTRKEPKRSLGPH